MDVFKLNPLHFVSFPGYTFDCWLMSSGTILDTLQDKQILDVFIEAKRGGIRGVRGDRLVNSSNSNSNSKNKSMAKHDQRSIWYIDTNNLYIQ